MESAGRSNIIASGSSSPGGPSGMPWAADILSSSSQSSTTRRASSLNNLPPGMQRCSQCSFTGPASAFPMRRTGVGRVKSCEKCISKKVISKAQKDNKEPPAVVASVPTMSLDAYLALVESQKNEKFEWDSFVEIPEGMFTEGEHMFTRTNKLRDRLAEVTEFHWNQKKSTRGGKSTVVTYHCAQLEGEQTRRTPSDDPTKRRARRQKIPRYHCGGWLKFTVIDDNDYLVRIRITHAEPHPPFPDKGKSRAEDVHGHHVQDQDHRMPSPVESDVPMPPVDDWNNNMSIVVEYPLSHHQVDYIPPIPDHMRRRYDDSRIIHSRERIAALRSKFELLLETAEAGVPPDLRDDFESIFVSIERSAEVIRQGWSRPEVPREVASGVGLGLGSKRRRDWSW